MIDWPRLVELVHRHHRFLLTTHVRPDCDAIGSCLGFAKILDHLGKEAQIVVGYELPPGLTFLDPEGRVRRLGTDVSSEWVESIDALVILDTSAWAQLAHIEGVIRGTAAVKLVVDHHVSGDELDAEYFKDFSAEATGRLVAAAAERLGVPMTAEIADALFAALATDTGWFRFSSTDGDTYRLAGALVDAGVSPAALYAELYENESLARLQLIGRVMARCRTDLDGRVVFTHIRRRDFEETGAHPADSEDLINMTLSVEGTEVALILVEQRDGCFKVSLRSRCPLDCSDLLAAFGGGGHKAAAGAMVAGPLETAQARLLDAIRAAMR